MGNIVLLVVVLTTIWVGIDSTSNQIPINTKTTYTSSNPIRWIFACIFMWIVCFPLYLVARSKTLSERNNKLLNVHENISEELSNPDDLFCEIAEDLGFISNDISVQVLEEQKLDLAVGIKKTTSEYLFKKGHLTKEQIGRVLKMQERMKR